MELESHSPYGIRGEVSQAVLLPDGLFASRGVS
jgi:hypothetical protein